MSKQTKKETNKYSIYNYFVKNPKGLFTVVSIFVAILTAVLKYSEIINFKLYLRKWNISSEFISTSGSGYYSLLSMLILVASLITCLVIQLYELDKYGSYYKMVISIQIGLSTILKDNHKSLFKRKLSIKECRNANNECRQKIKELHEINKDTNKQILSSFAFCAIVVGTGISINLAFTSGYHTNNVLDFLLIALTIVCYSLFPFLVFVFRIKKAAKKRIKGSYKKYITELNNCVKKYVMKSKDETTLLRKLEISNARFGKICSFLIAITITIILIKCATTRFVYDNSLEITTYNEKDYLVVFSSDDKYYLEEIAIDNNTAFVNTNYYVALETDELIITNLKVKHVRTIH